MIKGRDGKLLSPLCALLGVALAWQQRGGLVGREVGLLAAAYTRRL
ncbi:hypothetical protein [Halomonas cerina]|uniref:Uncharacterized protein n=1 Tax=Halomonas cerina TaxID=447424 RepID=A0A839VAF6_9GAMM|nr:hypothetical protein [Halomonas cerina]MBB3191058.1 hypothetical protein [Halomonas cerina]